MIDLRDRKDKLTSKIFQKKLELMLEEQKTKYNNQIYRCVLCNQLFTDQQRESQPCLNSNIFVNYKGSIVQQHQADKYWDCMHFAHFVKKDSNIQWKVIFWKIWSIFK